MHQFTNLINSCKLTSARKCKKCLFIFDSEIDREPVYHCTSFAAYLKAKFHVLLCKRLICMVYVHFIMALFVSLSFVSISVKLYKMDEPGSRNKQSEAKLEKDKKDESES